MSANRKRQHLHCLFYFVAVTNLKLVAGAGIDPTLGLFTDAGYEPVLAPILSPVPQTVKMNSVLPHYGLSMGVDNHGDRLAAPKLKWWSELDLNERHSVYQTDILTN